MRHLRLSSQYLCVLVTREYQKLPWLSGRINADESILTANPGINVDALLWVQLRLQIAAYLASYVKMKLDDEPFSIESLIGTSEYHIEQGLEESNAFNLKEYAARFTMLNITKAIRLGDDLEKVIGDLKVRFGVLCSDRYVLCLVLK